MDVAVIDNPNSDFRGGMDSYLLEKHHSRWINPPGRQRRRMRPSAIGAPPGEKGPPPLPVWEGAHHAPDAPCCRTLEAPSRIGSGSARGRVPATATIRWERGDSLLPPPPLRKKARNRGRRRNGRERSAVVGRGMATTAASEEGRATRSMIWGRRVAAESCGR